MNGPDWRDWMPIGVYSQSAGLRVDWCNFQGIRFTDSFFQQTVSHALSHPARMLFRRDSPIGFLETLVGSCPGIPPTGFIFHVSRCGSTLVSQMLAAVPANIVLSEPPPFDQVLSLPPVEAARGIDPRTAWLRGLLSAWGRPRQGETRFFVKFDSWHILELPLIRQAFPDVPWIFLYRDPVEVLVSHRRVPGAQMVPGVVDPRRLGLDPASIDPAKLGEYTARVLARFYAAALDFAGLGRGLLVNYRDLPAAVPDEIARHFGLDLGADEQAQMAAAGQFNAKNPGLAYQPDSSGKQAEATEEIRQRADLWLGDLYRRLESARPRPASI
jgi:hypothetical protein